MSHRPNNAKKLARLRKQLTRHSLPAYIDLVQYLKDRRYAKTTGQAKRMLLDGKVRVGANAVGRRADPNAKAMAGNPNLAEGFVPRRDQEAQPLRAPRGAGGSSSSNGRGTRTAARAGGYRRR